MSGVNLADSGTLTIFDEGYQILKSSLIIGSYFCEKVTLYTETLDFVHSDVHGESLWFSVGLWVSERPCLDSRASEEERAAGMYPLPCECTYWGAMVMPSKSSSPSSHTNP